MAALDQKKLTAGGQPRGQAGNRDQLPTVRLGQVGRAPGAVQGEIAAVVDYPIAGSSLPEPSLELLPGQRHALSITLGHPTRRRCERTLSACTSGLPWRRSRLRFGGAAS